MGKLVQGESESSALPCPQRWLDLDERAVDGSSSGSETPVNTVFGCLLLAGRQSMPSDLLGEDDGRGGLALDARREDLLGEDFGAGTGESADQAGKGTLEDGAFADSHG